MKSGFDLLQQINDMDYMLTLEDEIPDGIVMSRLKTIYSKPEFISWKESAKYHLQSLIQRPIVSETLDLLDSFNGWNDEEQFKELQAKINIIVANQKDFTDEHKESSMVSAKLAKGTVVHTAFDDYTIVKQIGSGGNGRVFEAQDSDREHVAIKFIEKTLPSAKIKRFKNEISFCERHSHQNIVSIIDRGYAFLDEKDYIFYVMPLYSETLKDKIKSGISSDDAISIFLGIIQGLKFAHENGAIHRDIKPENILFSSNSNVPVICDFGIAHFSEEELLTVVETKATDRMANFQYSAPEQRIKGGKILPQTDIYSAALILNEMFTGEIPQAAGYKKISDVNEEYKYLDDLFDQLFIQDASKRLFPEDRILTDLKMLADQTRREKEKARLQSVISEMNDPGEFSAQIVNLDYKSPNLILGFSVDLPDGWVNMLRNGQYSHSAIMGYETHHLSKHGRNELCMPIRDDNEKTIKNVIGNIKEWVQTVNQMYTSELKRSAIARQQQEEKARMEEIDKLNKESRISKMLGDLL